jgi:hypothetical protein
MHWYRQAKKDSEQEKMRDWFYKRTAKHIDLVKKYCVKIFEYDEDRFEGLVERGEKHDESKYEDPEVDPYILISWQYKCKDDGIDWEPSEDMEDKMSKASEHHVKNNPHHPEFHCDQEKDMINKDDKDKPTDKIINATKMPDLDIAEMIADWMAMSEEKGDNPEDWANKNVNKKWKFDEDQEKLIYELINQVWTTDDVSLTTSV